MWKGESCSDMYSVCSEKRDGDIQEALEDYLQRSAHKIDDISCAFGMNDWIAQYRRRKLIFAGKVARQEDNRWSNLVLDWKPGNCRGREPGRSKTRWDDDMVAFAGGDWKDIAKNTEYWDMLMPAFIQGI